MGKHPMVHTVNFALGFLLLLALPNGVLAAGFPTAVEPAPPSSQLSGTLPAGGWAGFAFSYAGDFAKVGLLLDYSPSDDPNGRGLANGNQVTLTLYSPEAPLPSGTPVGTAGGNGGAKYFQLESPVGGTYVLTLNNWDSLGRPVDFSLKSVAVGGNGDPQAAPPGPALTLVGSSTGATAPSIDDGRTKRVALQAGHWLSGELPDELAMLRTSTGTDGGGVQEWQLNLDVAKRVAALLGARGVAVDILPATVPEGYRADAFVALHADGDPSGLLSGFKLASGHWSGTTAADEALIGAITCEYYEATKLGLDPHVSYNMTGYYAFNNRRYQHAVSAGTPAVILEMGFMTNASDLRLLLGSPDAVALGIARGILRFLGLPLQ